MELTLKWWPDVAGKKRGKHVGRGRKGTTLLLLTDARDIPLACHIAGANKSEVNLIEPLLDRAVVDQDSRRVG